MTAGSGEALRQQLEAAVCTSLFGRSRIASGTPHKARLITSDVWPLIDAALAAARVATATEIAEAIEARLDAAYPDALTLISVRDAAALAREVGGSVPAPKGDQ